MTSLRYWEAVLFLVALIGGFAIAQWRSRDSQPQIQQNERSISVRQTQTQRDWKSPPPPRDNAIPV